MTINTAIADPLGLVRAGLRALIAGEPGFSVVGEAGNGSELMVLAAGLRPDILVLDPGLLGLPPDQALDCVVAADPDLKVVILASPSDVSVAMSLLEAGAAGCFLKSDQPGEFLRGLRAVAAGELAVSSAVARRLIQHLPTHPLPAPVDLLTEREREILGLLTAGLSNKEIAQRLYLSVRTVEVHLRNIYGKLGVRSRLEAATRSLRGGPPVASD